MAELRIVPLGGLGEVGGGLVVSAEEQGEFAERVGRWTQGQRQARRAGRGTVAVGEQVRVDLLSSVEVSLSPDLLNLTARQCLVLF